MSVKRKAALASALKQCGRDDCECCDCPYLGGACDMPFIEYVTLPVHLLKDMKAELFEPESPWENDPDEEEEA